MWWRNITSCERGNTLKIISELERHLPFGIWEYATNRTQISMTNCDTVKFFLKTSPSLKGILGIEGRQFINEIDMT